MKSLKVFLLSKKILYSSIGVFFLIILFLGIQRYHATLAYFAWERFRSELAVMVLDPYNAVLFETIGSYYFSSEHYNIEKAEKYFKKSLSVNETTPLAHYQLARIHFIKGDLDEAIIEINREIELYPEYKRSYYVRGLVYGFLKKYDKAADDFKEFLLWMPDSWAGHNDLVWVLFVKGDFEGAEKYAREGLYHAPHNPWLSNALGVILMNKGEYEESKKYLLQAQEGFAQLTPEQWGRAYPGNNPLIYEEGQRASLGSAEENLRLLEEKQKGDS